MTGLQRLETARLVLRVPEKDDYLRLRDLVADPDVHKFLGPRPEDPTTDMFSRALRAAGSWQLYGYGMFLACDRQTGDLVGQVGMFHSLRGFGKGMDDVVEAGWIVARQFWGKGYAREAMEASLEWFDRTQEPRRITCMIERENQASVRLAERLGFAAYDEHQFADGAVIDLFERLKLAS